MNYYKKLTISFYFIIGKHMTKLFRSLSLWLVWITFEFFVFVNLKLHLLQIMLPLHSLQNLKFTGTTTPLLNDFFQLFINIADILSTSIILKFWERSTNRLLFLSPLKVLCS